MQVLQEYDTVDAYVAVNIFGHECKVNESEPPASLKNCMSTLPVSTCIHAPPVCLLSGLLNG